MRTEILIMYLEDAICFEFLNELAEHADGYDSTWDWDSY